MLIPAAFLAPKSSWSRQCQQKIPFAILVGVTFATLVLWQALRIQQHRITELRIQHETANISYAIEQEIQESIFALERMASRWDHAGKPERALWEADAALYVQHYGTFQAIAWVDPSFYIQWVVPQLGNEASQGFNVISESRRREAIKRAIFQRHTVVTRTVILAQGGRGFLVYVPIFHDHEFEGLIMGAFRSQVLLDKVVGGLEQQGSGEYAVTLYDGTDEIYTHRVLDRSINQQWSQPKIIQFREVMWQLTITPSQKFLNETFSPIPTIVLGGGLLLAILLATIAKLVLITYEQNRRTSVEITKALSAEKHLNTLKSQFITSASHQFRTPLAVISSSAGVLEDYYDKLEAIKRQKHLRRIQEAVHHMVNILEDILMIEQMEKGKLKCNIQTIDLNQFYENLVKEFALSDSQFRIVVSYSTATETHASSSNIAVATRISVDEQLIRQILSNLLSNALKYSPPDSPVFFDIRYRLQRVEFEIRDQGIGIPKDDLAEIFTPFHRGSNVGTTPGTGLGLTLVKRCVTLHNGTIAIHSESGSGTCVKVHIPAY